MKDVIYVDNNMCYYNPKDDKIYISKRLLDHKEAHDIALKHEMKHYRAKKNILKHLYIDFIDGFNWKHRKVFKILNKNRTWKDFLISISPIKKYHDGYDLDLFMTIFWIVYIFVLLCLRGVICIL